jgi:hypothetical protein
MHNKVDFKAMILNQTSILYFKDGTKFNDYYLQKRIKIRW